MNRFRALSLVACFAAAACDKDPAGSVKIVARPPEAAVVAEPPRPTDSIVRPPGVPQAGAPPSGTRSGAPEPIGQRAAGTPARPPEWRPNGCPPPPEEGSGPDKSGPDSLVVTGPCTFEHRAAVACETTPDDFLLTMSRKGARGATLMVYVNVEQYKGPGDYHGAQMFLGVQDKTNIYRWSSDVVDVTVGAGEQFAVLPKTRLDPEPLLVQCTGPMDNYQCEGRKEATAIEHTAEVVSGTLRCEEREKEK